MTPEITVAELLAAYGRDIREMLQFFRHRYGIDNPVKAYHRGRLQRTGFLQENGTLEYSVHGAGCSVESPEGRLVSFDLDERGQYLFDAWKFKLYADNPAVDELDNQALNRLAATHFYQG